LRFSFKLTHLMRFVFNLRHRLSPIAFEPQAKGRDRWFKNKSKRIRRYRMSQIKVEML
jgi:hypothetical protein